MIQLEDEMQAITVTLFQYGLPDYRGNIVMKKTAEKTVVSLPGTIVKGEQGRLWKIISAKLEEHTEKTGYAVVECVPYVE